MNFYWIDIEYYWALHHPIDLVEYCNTNGLRMNLCKFHHFQFWFFFKKFFLYVVLINERQIQLFVHLPCLTLIHAFNQVFIKNYPVFAHGGGSRAANFPRHVMNRDCPIQHFVTISAAWRPEDPRRLHDRKSDFYPSHLIPLSPSLQCHSLHTTPKLLSTIQVWRRYAYNG